MAEILILEANDYIRAFGADSLRRAGHTVTEASSAAELTALLEVSGTFDGAIVDAAFSECCGDLRLQYPEIAILAMADAAQQADAVTGLMIGADEELKKPFSPAQICEKMEKLLVADREEEIRPETLLSSGPFILDTGAYSLDKMGSRILLTRPEYSMMKLFLENPGKALTQDEIYRYVWGREDAPALNRVAEVIRCLRLKIEDDPQNPVFITTVWGYGYQWK